MKITKFRVLGILVAVLIVVVIAKLPKRKPEFPAPEEQIYTIKSEVIERSDMQEYMLLNGNVELDNTISVFPDISGKLVRVPVTIGNYVRKNQLVAEVDPSVPGEVYAKSPVYAPIEGYITSLPLTPGTTVSTSTEIAKIGNIKTLQIEAKIPEGKIAVLKTGLTAEVTLEAYKNETFPAHIFRISPIVDESSRTKTVYFIFDTNDSRINAGMYVRIKLNTVLHRNALSVPTDAVLSDGGVSYVYVVDSNMTVTKRNIQLGASVDGREEVVSGLIDDERVVVNGMQVLSDGVTVREVGTPLAQSVSSGNADNKNAAGEKKR